MKDLMLELIQDFPKHILDALRIGEEGEITITSSPENIVITGLGGSGIGGKIISQYARSSSLVPIVTNNSYDLPGFVSKRTLVIVCSYSGNTEETVNAINEAVEKEAEVVVVTSGGEVEKVAKKNGFCIVEIPGGNPPRSMFAYSAIMLLFVLHRAGIIKSGFKSELKDAAELLEHDTELIQKLARNIARKISRRVPIIYAEDKYEGVAIRWKQQFNENAKMLCWANAIPEMNHNELVGWAGGDDRFAVIILRNQDDFIKNKIRTDISQQIISKKSDMVMEVASKGNSMLERIFYLVHVGDWMSYHLAAEREVDPVVIDEIEFLKKELGKY